MNWNRHIIHDLFHAVQTRIYLGLLLFAILIFGMVKHMQPDQTIPEMKEFIASQRMEVIRGLDFIRLRQEMEPGFDAEGFVKENLMNRDRALAALQEKLRVGDLRVGEEQEAFYELFFEEAIRHSEIPFSVDENMALEELKKGEYMADEGLPISEERVPSDTALLAYRVSNWVFGLGSGVLLVVLFGLAFFQDSAEQKFDLYFTLPIQRRKLMTKYSIRLIWMMVAVIFLYSLSLLPMLLSGQSGTLKYPIIIHRADQLKVFPLWQILLLRMLIWSVFVGILHILSLVLSYFIKSFEVVVLALIGILFVLQILMGNDRWQLWNPVQMISLREELMAFPGGSVYLIGSFLLVLVLLWILYRVGFVSDLPQQLMDQRAAKVQRSLRFYAAFPPWISFEWTKRIRFKSSQRLGLFLLVTLMVGYGYITVLHHQGMDQFKVELQGEITTLEQSILFHKTLKLEALATAQRAMGKEYAARVDQKQTFEEWYKQESPESYSMMNDGLTASELRLKQVEETLSKVELDQFPISDLIAHRNEVIEIYRTRINPMVSGTLRDDVISLQPILEMEQRNRIIAEKGLTPLFSTDLFVIPPPLENERQEGLRGAAELSNSTLYSSYLLIQRHGGLIVVCLLLLGFAITMSEEYEQNHSIEWLMTLPKPRDKLYWNKLFSSVGMVFGLLMGGIVLLIIISAMIGGLGEGEYPIVVIDPKEVGNQFGYIGYYASENQIHFHFVTLFEYLQKSLLLLFSEIFFLIGLLLCLSTFIRRRMALLVVTVIVCIGGYVLSFQQIRSMWTRFLPFLYLNLRDILDGWMALLGDKGGIHPDFGALILIVWGIVLILAGWIRWRSLTQNPKERQDI
ncbi:MAG: hypothetical protein Q4G61_08230 [Tissierellia bacterium]|nr:hypothetical protein [Tissierellia bacterium]